jgi:hypothetical protein
MDIDLAALPDDVEALQHLVRSLAAERSWLSEAKAEIERLNLIIKKLQRHQFGQRAERLNDDQLQLGLEDLTVDLARTEARLPPVKTKPDKPEGERPSLPAHLPREDVRLDVEQACPCCGGAVHLIGETVSEMLDHVPGGYGSPYLSSALWLPGLRDQPRRHAASVQRKNCAVGTSCHSNRQIQVRQQRIRLVPGDQEPFCPEIARAPATL